MKTNLLKITFPHENLCGLIRFVITLTSCIIVNHLEYSEDKHGFRDEYMDQKVGFLHWQVLVLILFVSDTLK